ncbi:hypothetical protein HPB49_014822 [Dermacentor silvarum]|uniref:Uncharacterized protein n=1 Tax=Dermacentor silvarum TaxID=543639 RepID=A0ACB8C462_DERSI|nr:hypothetical protein HPB49_014822 [Dermacentor silvarum]
MEARAPTERLLLVWAPAHQGLRETKKPTRSPEVSHSGTDDSIVQIQNVTIANAELGERLLFIASILSKKTQGSSPVLNIYVTSSTGKPLPCAYSVVPKQLKLCDGETVAERLFNFQWNNHCPVSPGQYNAILAINVPDGLTALSCVGENVRPRNCITLLLYDESFYLPAHYLFHVTCLGNLKDALKKEPQQLGPFVDADNDDHSQEADTHVCDTGLVHSLKVFFASLEAVVFHSHITNNLNLCDGKTRTEKRLNKAWNNRCPVHPGTYNAELVFRLPNNKEAKEYFGDGNVVATVKIVDDGQLLGCATYPIKVDVD